MRKLIIGTYDTSADGWTLAALEMSEPLYRSNMITVPGRSGALDYSAAPAGGDPPYDPRSLTASLELSAGTHDQRETVISTVTNALDGRVLSIVIPDDAAHYVTGRVHVKREYNDLAHAAVTITATCDPWRCKNAVTTVTRDDLTANYKTLTLTNERRSVVPSITVTEETTLLWGTATYTIAAGTYKLPDIVLTQGSNTLKAKLTTAASGSITIEYQEASL